MFVVAPCEITLTEFIDGAARLRGGAKAIDVWRMETKLEVLFEEAEGKMKEIFLLILLILSIILNIS